MTRSTLILLFLGFVLSSCSYVQKVRDGRTAHDRKQYAVATKLLKKEYNKAKSRVEKGKLAFLMGESFEAMNKSDQAIEWFEIAYNYQYGVEALKRMALALKKAERYEEAIEAFRNLGFEIGSPYEYRREIQSCELALGWQDNKYQEYRVELLEFNSSFSDYSPTLYKNNQMIITSDRKASTGDNVYNWTGNDFSDLFLVDLNSNSIAAFDEIINSNDNEGTVCFSKDYQEIYFTRCYGGKKEDAYCQILVSESSGDSWTVPSPLPFTKKEVNYGHPALSPDGQQLYFSCNDPDGWGGYDIYVSERGPDGWEEPKLMNRSINSPGNEKFPTIDSDTLYFSSDYHLGSGGLDIFKTYPLSNGSWAPPYNLLPPINSGGDDFGLIIDQKAAKKDKVLQVGYLTSTRNDGIGSDDIYRFEKIIPPPKPEPEDPEPVAIEYKMILNVYVLEKIYDDPTDPNSQVLGRKPLNGAKVIMQSSEEKEEAVVGEDGLFSVELDKESDYYFVGIMEKYLNNEATFSTKGIGEDPNNPVRTFEVEIVLDKIFLDKEIVLENIYYDFDRWEIRDDAKPTLDELTKNLNLNPTITIQLASHTDCRGNPRYNEDLSQKRAQSAVDYLIEKGISADRLSAKGYGENEPAIDCICSRCDEDQHQKNRRTTFKIIE